MSYKKFNLYEGVKISEGLLAKAIILGVALLFVAMVFGSSAGFTVNFETDGGSEIPEQHIRYGEKVSVPKPPIREGYIFDGWSSAKNSGAKYDFENERPTDDITLYANWVRSSTSALAEINE